MIANSTDSLCKAAENVHMLHANAGVAVSADRVTYRLRIGQGDDHLLSAQRESALYRLRQVNLVGPFTLILTVTGVNIDGYWRRALHRRRYYRLHLRQKPKRNDYANREPHRKEQSVVIIDVLSNPITSRAGACQTTFQ